MKRVLKYQFLSETYTQLTVPALSKIKGHLLADRQKIQAEYEAASKRVKQYRCVGSGFEELVKEYTNIMKEVQNKEWALQELQRGQ